MLQFSLVFMLQERGPRQKTRLMTDIITFGVGNSTILNQDGKTKILSYVACFYSKCLAKMKNERPAWQNFLTIKRSTNWANPATVNNVIKPVTVWIEFGRGVKQFLKLIFLSSLNDVFCFARIKKIHSLRSWVSPPTPQSLNNVHV